jgi:hypothetical protein
MLISLLACKFTKQTNQQILLTYFMSYKVVSVFFALALFALMFIILILTRLSLVFFIWHLLVVCKTTFVLRVPVITCFNCGKVRYKSCACSKPQKPSIIYEIKEKDFNTNVTNIIDKDLGKEQA